MVVYRLARRACNHSLLFFSFINCLLPLLDYLMVTEIMHSKRVLFSKKNNILNIHKISFLSIMYIITRWVHFFVAQTNTYVPSSFTFELYVYFNFKAFYCFFSQEHIFMVFSHLIKRKNTVLCIQNISKYSFQNYYQNQIFFFDA